MYSCDAGRRVCFGLPMCSGNKRSFPPSSTTSLHKVLPKHKSHGPSCWITYQASLYHFRIRDNAFPSIHLQSFQQLTCPTSPCSSPNETSEPSRTATYTGSSPSSLHDCHPELTFTFLHSYGSTTLWVASQGHIVARHSIYTSVWWPLGGTRCRRST